MDELISRQAALVAVKNALMAFSYMPEWRDEKILEAIAELPPAQHEIPDDARDAFMNLVYDELHSDGDNNRANRIIDAADEYVEYSLAKQSAKLGTDLAEVGTRAVRGYPIDADALMEKVAEEYGERARDRLYQIIRYMPPAKPEQRTGEYVHVSGYSDQYKCTACGIDIVPMRVVKFCPECGTKILKMISGERIIYPWEGDAE